MRERDPPVGTFHRPFVTSTHFLFLMNLKQYKGWSSLVFWRERYSVMLNGLLILRTHAADIMPYYMHFSNIRCHICHIIRHFQNRRKTSILHTLSFLRRPAHHESSRISLPSHTAQQFFSSLSLISQSQIIFTTLRQEQKGDWAT